MLAEPVIPCLLQELLPKGSCLGPNGTALLQQQCTGLNTRLVHEHSGHHQEGSDSPSTLSWQKGQGQLSGRLPGYHQTFPVLSLPLLAVPLAEHGLEVSQPEPPQLQGWSLLVVLDG